VFAATLLLFCPTVGRAELGQADFIGVQPRTPLSAQKSATEADFLVIEAMRFRHVARENLETALRNDATPQGQQIIAELSKAVWTIFPASLGWNKFFSTSLVMFGSTGKDQALSAFYHPWSDTVLMLAWSRASGQWKIDDGDWVLGDWFRRIGKPPVDTQPLWLRKDGPKSDALLEEVAQTVQVFEGLFPEDVPASDWRELLRLRQMEPGRKLNRDFASVNLNAVLLNQAEFLAADKAEAKAPVALREAQRKAQEAIEAGNMELVLAGAAHTDPAHAKALLKIDSNALTELYPVAYLPASQDPDNLGGLVFVVSADQADFAISMRFGEKTGQLDRLQLIPLAAADSATRSR
ncbi:MAG: hypothetical protein GYA47_07105, partial [Desulfovibrio sp.]|nr:hypothetical protein [Desulfovibrio sp.]